MSDTVYLLGQEMISLLLSRWNYIATKFQTFLEFWVTEFLL